MQREPNAARFLRMARSSDAKENHLKRMIILAVMATAILTAKSKHDWQTAKLVDSHTFQTDDVTGVARQQPLILGGGLTARVQHITLTQMRLVNEEFSYTVQCVGYPGHFILGDQVKFYVTKSIMHITNADGKEGRFLIIRQERVKEN